MLVENHPSLCFSLLLDLPNCSHQLSPKAQLKSSTEFKERYLSLVKFWRMGIKWVPVAVKSGGGDQRPELGEAESLMGTPGRGGETDL